MPQNIALGNSLQKIQTIYLKNSYKNDDFAPIPPVVVQDIIYVLNKNSLDAYNIETGKQVWQTNLIKEKHKNNFYGGGMAAIGNMLIVTNGTKYVSAMDLNTGKPVWQYSLANVSRSAPYTDGNSIYVLTIDSKLYALTKDGEFVFSHQGPNEQIAIAKNLTPAAKNGVVIAPYKSGDVYFLNSTNGEEGYQIQISSPNGVAQGNNFSDINATPLIDNNNLYLINYDGEMICFNLRTAQTMWGKSLRGYKNLWLAGEYIYLSSDVGDVIAINKESGQIKWVSKIGIKRSGLKGPVMAGNFLIFTTSGGEIVKVSPEDGSIKNVIDAGDNIFAFPIVVENKLIVATNKSIIIYGSDARE